MIIGRLLLAAAVVLTTDPGGCRATPADDGPPPISAAEARAAADSWLRDLPLGPVEVDDCGSSEHFSGTVCTVRRQGRTFAVQMERWPGSSVDVTGVVAPDPETFAAQTLALVGTAPRSVDCDVDPCLARFAQGEAVREVRLTDQPGFVGVQVEARGSRRTTAVGGGPVIHVALQRGQHLAGPDVTVRGSVEANPSTHTPVSEVCVSPEGATGSGTCAAPDADGAFTVLLRPGGYAQALRITASDVAGAETDALVPVSVHDRVARLRLLTPLRASTTSATGVTVTWRVNHADLVASVDVQVDGEVAATFDPNGRSTGTLVIDRAWTMPGEHTVALMAVTTDRAGWTMTTPIRLTYTP